MKDTLTERDLRTLLALKSAILDEKDAEIARQFEQVRAMIRQRNESNAQRDEALSRIAELEAAIAEAWDRAYVEPLRPFVKQPVDPLVEAWKDAWPGTPDENAREEADKLRGVLPRHGLAITEVKG